MWQRDTTLSVPTFVYSDDRVQVFIPEGEGDAKITFSPTPKAWVGGVETTPPDEILEVFRGLISDAISALSSLSETQESPEEIEPPDPPEDEVSEEGWDEVNW